MVKASANGTVQVAFEDGSNSHILFMIYRCGYIATIADTLASMTSPWLLVGIAA